MIQAAGTEDLKVLANLGVLLWPQHTAQDLFYEFSGIMGRGESQFFIKYHNGEPVGFAQCQLRHDYVEGTQTTPVGYLEGIFIKKEYRKKGYARELLAACEAWAKTNGCLEFASDCELDNNSSYHFHKAMNFSEANRIICFTKEL